LIIDQTFGQSIGIDVRDKDTFDKDDSLGMYVLYVLYMFSDKEIFCHVQF